MSPALRARRFRGAFGASIAAMLAALSLASPARADFGLANFDVAFTGAAAAPSMQAGSHPFAMTTSFEVNTVEEGGGEYVDGAIRTLDVFQASGFVGTPNPGPRCSSLDFLRPFPGAAVFPDCPDSSALGYVVVFLGSQGVREELEPSPVYNLESPPGVAAKLGFWIKQVPVAVELGVNPEPPYNVVAHLAETSQAVEVFKSELVLWGNPADPAHDELRGHCLRVGGPTGSSCPANVPIRPFFTLPRSCRGPLITTYSAASWWSGGFLEPGPAATDEGFAETHDNSIPPEPLGTTGCGNLSFSPEITAIPTSKAAQSPSGLDFALEVHDEGLTNPEGLANADIARAEVKLPDGFTANPALAEGLEVCTEVQLDTETAFSDPGEGCPDASKIGTVEVETPLLEEPVRGSLFIAEPYRNPFGSLLALYIVIKNPNLGIVVKQPLEVRPDPVTGRLTTVADHLPELPFSSFRLHFREGARSPLATPPSCDAEPSTPERDPFVVEARLTPSSGAAPITTTSSFELISGPDHGPCPSGGLPPFKPDLLAGTLNNRAGAFSPFNLRLSRRDGEQELTRFSIKLPPGIAAILAGVPHCPDGAIEAAKYRTGTEELAGPSCPAASQIGRSLAGAGVGPSPAYAPGRIYLAGPYQGAPISIAAITAARVGPFDLGTVVVRQGFKIDPRTAEVFLDPLGSDPIPHIIDGIVVHARDIRAYVDRPDFVFNPTSCERTSTASTVWGSGLDFASPADDNPVVVSTPFQAADCAALAFKPKLRFRLKGATRRGGHPSLRASVSMKGLGEAAIASARVTLPRSEFLENANIGTVCTRVQYTFEQCPAGSIYGRATATTPILDQPLTGAIYLRSSEHQLPDLVAAFKSAEGIRFDLVGRVDSVKGGGIRNAFEIVPDAPIASADFTFFGRKKGLLVNSTNVCKGKHRVKVELTAHNGRRLTYRTPLKAKCGKGKRRNRHRGAAR
jgi:hypothetical protein